MAVLLNNIKATPATKVIQGKSFTYKDMKLDFASTYRRTPSILGESNVSDVKPILDYEAISQSLANILTTSPGERMLDPEFGLDLRDYLFAPVNRRIAYLIGLDFLQKLPTLEPRILVTNVTVEALQDDNLYVISATFIIPQLETNTEFTLKGKLNSDGFIFYEQQ